MAECKHYYRVLILGDSSVGKSSLLQRYVGKSFSGEAVHNASNIYKNKTLEYEGLVVELEMWDIVEDPVSRTALEGANGAMFCYSITDPNSFSNLIHWYEQVDKFSSDLVCKVVVATKSDLKLERTVDNVAGKEFADKLNVPFVETSAKNGNSVKAAFKAMAKELLTNEYPWGIYDRMTITFDDINEASGEEKEENEPDIEGLTMPPPQRQETQQDTDCCVLL